MKTSKLASGYLLSFGLVISLSALAAPYYGQTQTQNQGQQQYRQTDSPYAPSPYRQADSQAAPAVYAPAPAPVRPQYQYRRQQQGFRHDEVITLHSTPLNSFITLGGTVIPFKEVTLAAQIPGRIEFIAGSEGAYIEQGQVLVTIDDDDLLAQRRQALAALGNAESAIRNARVQYSRELWSPQSKNINRMPGMGMPSMFDQLFTKQAGQFMGYGNPNLERSADLYSRGTQVSQAQSQALKARSKLEEIDAKLRDTRSVAPFSGLIVKKFVEVGDTIQPGQPMLKLADTKTLQLKVDVPARLMPGIQKGMVLTAKLDVGNKYVEAKVAQIFPMADIERHTVTVKLDLPKGVQGGPGMYAEVVVPDIKAASRNVILIPKSAVRGRGSLPAVYRLNADNKPELRYIRLGEAIDANTITVLSGLHENDRILANPGPEVVIGKQPVSK